MSKHAELIERLRLEPTASQFLNLSDLFSAMTQERKQAADALEAQAREIEGLRKQDDALILQLVEALCECAEDSQEQLDRMEAARLRDYKPNAIAWQEDTIAKAKAAIVAGRARLEGKTHEHPTQRP